MTPVQMQAGDKATGATAFFDSYGEIRLVVTPNSKRGQGGATRVMEQVIAWSEQEAVTLRLLPMPMDQSGLSEPDLVAWYHRLGFEDDGGFMVRRPGPALEAACRD